MLRYIRFRPETRSTLRGLPFVVLKEEPGVPRIDDRILDCSIYLYPSEVDAKRRKRAGGTGFLVSVSAAGDGWLARGECPDNRHRHAYAVSNRHVIQGRSGDPDRPPAPVVGINTHEGKFDVIPLKLEDWTCSEEHDLAVVPLGPRNYKYIWVGMEMAVDKDLMAEHGIGLGDEVFLVGRFVSHDGEQRNSPAIRWGHIAMMPFEPIHHPSNKSHLQESFLVEIHTAPGYSGSPVLVRPFPTQKFTIPKKMSTKKKPPYASYKTLATGPWLLGVEWGNINTHNPAFNTGMSGVVPAWCILDLLNTEKFKAQRKQEQEEHLQRCEQGGTTLT